jgi:hypothetical protein
MGYYFDKFKLGAAGFTKIAISLAVSAASVSGVARVSPAPHHADP